MATTLSKAEHRLRISQTEVPESVLEETLLYPLNRGVVGSANDTLRPTRAMSTRRPGRCSLRPGLDQHSSTTLRSDMVEAFLAKLSAAGGDAPL